MMTLVVIDLVSYGRHNQLAKTLREVLVVIDLVSYGRHNKMDKTPDQKML